VYDPVLVGVLKTAGRLQDAVQRQAGRQGPLLLNQRRQVDALHVLHHQERPAVRFVGIVGDHDIRMREPRGGLHFLLKPPQ